MAGRGGQVDVGSRAEGLDGGDGGADCGGVGGIGGGEAEVFGANAEHQLTVVMVGEGGGPLWGQRDFFCADEKGWGGAVYLEAAGQEVHGRRSEEAGDESVGGSVVDLHWLGDLLDSAGAEDAYPVGEGHGLGLVVGDVNAGGGESPAEGFELGSHGEAHGGIDVAEGLVEEKDLRVADDGPAECDSLSLAARECGGLSLQEALDIEKLGDPADAAFDLGAWDFAHFECEGHVAADGHVGVERVVLEDHCDVAVLRGDVVDGGIADPDIAGGGLFEACDDAEDGCFSAAARADDYHELAVGDGEGEVFDGGDVRVVYSGYVVQ